MHGMRVGLSSAFVGQEVTVAHGSPESWAQVVEQYPVAGFATAAARVKGRLHAPSMDSGERDASLFVQHDGEHAAACGGREGCMSANVLHVENAPDVRM